MSGKITQTNNNVELSNGTDDGSSKAPEGTALQAFFQSMEARTSDPLHLRLLKAAAKRDRVSALEREFTKIMQEILDEA